MALLGVLQLALFPMPAGAAGIQMLRPGHVPPGVANGVAIGRLPGLARLDLAIGLPLRNRQELTNLLQQIYDPASAHYHRYLTPEEFAQRFGPTEKDYQKLISFAKAHGLTIKRTHPNRTLLDVNGPVSAIEQVFHLTLRVYQHPREARTFYAPDTEPSIDLTIPLLAISGLDNYTRPHPMNLRPSPLNATATALPLSGSGPGGNYMGKDFRAAYAPGVSLTGFGQTVALLEFDGYFPSDIAAYETQAGLPNVTLTNVLLDGDNGVPGINNVEVALDIEMAISMAPGLSQVMVYEGGPDGIPADLLNRMATDKPLAKQISSSWGWRPYDPNSEQVYLQYAFQGQSFFCACGDEDAFVGPVPWAPEDDPYITLVGGTTLTTSGPGGSWVSETVWNWSGGVGTGGGISITYPIPSWQQGIDMSANQGSTTMRNIPDVAMTADNIWVIFDNGGSGSFGGTSCATPLWAGFAALVNQQAVATGKPTIGLINPAIYAIGKGSSYSGTFHDITTGNNTSSASPNRFYAVAGYDLCTGWGTPAGSGLINTLVTPDELNITPRFGFASQGPVGGPFSVSTQTFSLTNAGTAALSWTLANTSIWLNVTPSAGTLTPGGLAASVTVGLNAAAASLVGGIYNDTICLTNLHDGVVQSLDFALTVFGPPILTAQPTDQAVLEGATATFNVTAVGTPPLHYQWLINGNTLSDGGSVLGSSTSTLTISNVSSPNVGSYSVVVSNFANTVVGITTSKVAQLTLTPSAPVIVRQPSDQSVFVGRTAWFSVTVFGTTPFGYQWSLNGTNSTGATNASLTITNAQFAQGGEYSLLVTNALGSMLSSNALLTVNPPPPCVPPPPGLVSWWRAEGNALDQVGTNNGTLVGGATFGSGMVGQAFSFNGTGAYVQVADSPSLNLTNQLTIEFWYKDAGSSQPYGLVAKRGTGPGPCNFGINANNGLLFFYLLDPNILAYQGCSCPIPMVGVFHHLAGTFSQVDATHVQAKLYVDGEMAGDSVFPANLANTVNNYPVTIGASASIGEFFEGLIDEVSIYNQALPATEIASIYAANLSGKCLTPNPPVISSEPANETVLAGETASFSVTATGTTPLSYQWRLNGSPLGGQTNSSLTLLNVQLSDEGLYSVLVTNAYGSMLSSNAVLTVNPQSGCLPPPPGLVSWWRAEGNALDQVGTNNGTLVGGATFGSGMVGQAFSFNGTGAYVQVADSPSLNLTNQLTIEFWYKDAGSSQPYGLVAKRGTGTGPCNFGINANNGSLFFYLLDPSFFNYQGCLCAIPSAGVFHHLAGTFSQVDATHVQANLYVDGQLAGNSLLQANLANTVNNYPVTIGATASTGEFFNGLIDEVSIYNQALSSNEIQAIFAAGSSGKCVSGLAPTIVTQPTNQLALLGCSVTFSVVSSGVEPLSYQWWKGNQPLNAQTNPILELSNVRVSDFGSYRVVVSNAHGSVTSSDAQLEFDHLPVAGPATVQRFAWGGTRVSARDLLLNDTDADGDTLRIVDVSSNSAAGGTVSLQDNWVYYLPPSGFTNTDMFTYTMYDGHCGGEAVGTVAVQIKTNNCVSVNSTIQPLGNTSFQLSFGGVPGGTARIQYSESLSTSVWQDLATGTADKYGVFWYIDSPPTNAPARFYRSLWSW